MKNIRKYLPYILCIFFTRKYCWAIFLPWKNLWRIFFISKYLRVFFNALLEGCLFLRNFHCSFQSQIIASEILLLILDLCYQNQVDVSVFFSLINKSIFWIYTKTLVCYIPHLFREVIKYSCLVADTVIHYQGYVII